MANNDLPRVGISIGDINGIGPELIIRTISDPRITELFTPVIYGSPKVLSFYRKSMGLNEIFFNLLKNPGQLNTKKANMVVCWEEDVMVKPGEDNSDGGKYALISLDAAIKDLKAGNIDVLVTAPLNKHNIPAQAGHFTGHTEYLANAYGNPEHIMLLVANELKVALATGHVPLGQVSSKLTPELILSKLRILKKSLQEDFSIVKPRIAVLGINPHAGDSGLIGNEEKDVIIPALQAAEKENIMAFGPYSPDGFFGARQFHQFDAVLAMYHDQGLIPFKYMAFEDGVNFTAGLPIVRTSPDHGTAYPIAGKNQAIESSFRNAVYLACDIFKRRRENSALKDDPLKFTALKKERFRMDF